MGFFKIRNITPSLSKRDSRQNTPQSIELTGTYSKSNLVLPPNAEFVFESNFLPVQLHKLRVENVISVLEISRDEFLSIAAINDNTVKEVVTETKKETTSKKEQSKKEVVTEISVEQKEKKSKQQDKNFI